MPNSVSAKKSLRQNLTRRARNRSDRAALRTVLKKFSIAAAGDNPEAAEAAFREASKRLDQAAANNLIHKNKAARTKSRLSKLLISPSAASDE